MGRLMIGVKSLYEYAQNKALNEYKENIQK